MLSEIFGPSTKAMLTASGGLAVRLINGTGAPTVKGTLVTASRSADLTAVAQTNMFDTFGVMYESGVAAGAWCWVVVSGLAQVLYAAGETATRGNVCVANTTDGRASDIANFGGGLPAADEHFKEIGHVLETKVPKDAQTSVLAFVNLHFN
jgi:hypothetical protein